jgi:uncharacterized membrane protein YbhN (UPF0104 family)
MKRLIIAALASLACAAPAFAQFGGSGASPVKEVCVTPTVTTANAYGINYVVGGLLTFSFPFPPSGSGVVQSVYVNIKDVE